MYVIQILKTEQELRNEKLSEIMGEEIRIEDSTNLSFISKSRASVVKGVTGAVTFKTLSGAQNASSNLTKQVEEYILTRNSTVPYGNRGRNYWRRDAIGRRYSLTINGKYVPAKMKIRKINAKDWNDDINKKVSLLEGEKNRMISAFNLKINKVRSKIFAE